MINTKLYGMRRNSGRLLLLFIGGFILGMSVSYIGQDYLVGSTSFLDSYSIARMGELDVNRMGFLLYCLKKRLVPAGIMAVAGLAGAGGLAVFAWLVWTGFGAGMILSVLSIRYGIRGILLFAAGVLPQALILVPAYLMLCQWCLSYGMPAEGGGAAVRSFGRGSSAGFDYAGIHSSGLVSRGKTQGMGTASRLLRFLGAVAMILTGVMLEAWVNPLLIKGVIGIF